VESAAFGGGPDENVGNNPNPAAPPAPVDWTPTIVGAAVGLLLCLIGVAIGFFLWKRSRVVTTAKGKVGSPAPARESNSTYGSLTLETPTPALTVATYQVVPEQQEHYTELQMKA
jgi:hypothetical protein